MSYEQDDARHNVRINNRLLEYLRFFSPLEAGRSQLLLFVPI